MKALPPIRPVLSQSFRELQKLAGLTLALLLITAAPQRSQAINASPHPVNLQQPDGTPITLRIRGDEWFNWHEDMAGYTVVADQGTYYYARLDANDRLVPTAFVVGKDNPQQQGLAPRILPSRNTIAQARANFSAPSGTVAPKRIAATGVVKNLVILCKFNDHTFGTHTRAQADYDTIMNKVGGDPTLAPTGSLRDYYLETSYGIVTLNSTVVAWVTLPQTEAYYGNGADGLGLAYPRNAQGMVEDALKAADGLVDFGQFDLDLDGFVDAIDIIHSGYAAETGGGGGNWMWSHKWSLFQLPGGVFTSADNNSSGTRVKVYDYHTEAALWDITGTEILRVGVIAHETGHFFGLPDLYDTDDTSEGIGSYCLMANSWGFDGTQRHPPHPSAWARTQLGWMTPQVITPGTYTAPRANVSPTAFRIDHGYPSGEYLLVENRQSFGFESMPQGGLVIWHIDEAKPDNTAEGYPGQAGWPGNNRHYRIALLQADGRYDMEHGLNRGDAGDVWRGGGVSLLSTNTVPNTHAYKNGVTLVTSNTIGSISASSATMSFTYNDGTSNSPTPAVTIVNASVVEGNSGFTNLSFLATIFPSSTQSVSVSYAVSAGTATAGNDFTASSGVLTFPPGATSQSLLVPVVGEFLVEGDETVLVTLSSPVNCTITNGIATGTILNDDIVLFPPLITSVSTNAAPVGATVTIYGNYFSPIVSQNMVYFGAVRAMVLSAATNQLQVTVPAGAGFAPISVTAGGYTDYSLSPFMVTFDSSAVLNPDTFAGRVDLGVSAGSRSVITADLDNDGRLDIATANQDSNTVSVLRNLSSSTTLNTSSFASKQTLDTGSGPVAVAAGDLDGDGLLDLVVANYSGANISIFLNTSLAGNLSFAARVDFATAGNPRDVAIADLDGDDRPEIIVASESDGKIQVLQNLTALGLLNASTFGSPVGFVVGKNPAALAIADIDGDGREDVIVANSFNGIGGNTITLLRNTTTQGTIDTSSLATRVNYPSGAAPASLAVGDLDGDGRLDIVTGNTLANSMSIFRNTASPGAFNAGSLAPKVDVSSGSPVGSLRQVTMGDINGDGLPDLVCVNQAINTVTVLRNQYVSNTSLDAGSFVAPISYSMASSPADVTLADLNRDGRLELVSVSSGIVSIRRNLLKLNPQVIWPAPAPVAYGNKLSTNELNAAANIAGAFIYTPPTGTVITASIQSLVATFIPADPVSYNSISTTNPLTVVKAIPIVTWSNPGDIVYGTALSSTQLNAAATFNGEPLSGTFDYLPASGSVLDVGASQNLSVMFTPADTANFNAVGANVSINVTKATPVVSWSNPSAIVYGTALGGAQLNATVKHLNQAVPGTFAYSPNTNTVLAVGDHTLNLTFTPDNPGNFDAPAAASVSITVTKAPLGIRAVDKNKYRGEGNPALTAAYFGFVNSDDELDLLTPVILGTSADENSPVGDYPITISGATSANYSITFTNGVLHVTSDDPPIITLFAAGHDYYEDGSAVLLDSSLTITDAASQDFDGGVLTVSLSNGQTSDWLNIIPGGVGADEVSFSSTNVLVGGVIIGWQTGGTNGSPLVVHLNTNATPAATQTLARQLAFSNVSEAPGSATRIVQIDLTDGDGGSAAPATLPIYVYPQNDLPTITLVGPTNNASFIAPGPVTFTASVTDVDGTVVKVEYYVGETKLGESTTGPDFAFTWDSAMVGEYDVYAVAIDDEGGTNSTDEVTVLMLPGITMPGFDQEGHFTMTFAGENGVIYDIEWSSDLINWNYLDTVTGTGEAEVIVDSTSTGTEAQRFYRFVPQPEVEIRPK